MWRLDADTLLMGTGLYDVCECTGGGICAGGGEGVEADAAGGDAYEAAEDDASCVAVTGAAGSDAADAGGRAAYDRAAALCGQVELAHECEWCCTGAAWLWLCA